MRTINLEDYDDTGVIAHVDETRNVVTEPNSPDLAIGLRFYGGDGLDHSGALLNGQLQFVPDSNTSEQPEIRSAILVEKDTGDIHLLSVRPDFVRIVGERAYQNMAFFGSPGSGTHELYLAVASQT